MYQIISGVVFTFWGLVGYYLFTELKKECNK